MIKRPNTNAQRLKRHKRVRAKISGTPEMPRLNVFRSEANIYAQVIDDVAGVTLVSASSLDKSIDGYGGNVAAATAVGKLVAERALEKGVKHTCVAVILNLFNRIFINTVCTKGFKEPELLDITGNCCLCYIETFFAQSLRQFILCFDFICFDQFQYFCMSCDLHRCHPPLCSLMPEG